MRKETENKTKLHCGGELSSGPAKHDSFILYESLWDNISDLSYEDKGRLFEAIFKFKRGVAKSVIEESLPVGVKMAFRFVASQLERDGEKYVKMCENKRKAANKRWGKTESDARASSALHNDTESESETVSEPDTVSDSETDTDTDTGKEEINSSSSSSNNDSDGVAKKEDEEEEKNFSEIFKKAEEAWMPWFNSLLKMNGSAIPPLKMMTPKRAKKLFRLARKYGNEKAQEVFRRAAQTPFLNGKGKKSTFVASFDWLLEEKNFLNVYEGKFYG